MGALELPLPPKIAACRGISPARRDELTATAKGAAMRFAWAVKRRSAAEVFHLTEGWGRDEWAALAVVLAEGVKPGDLRLLAVTRAPENDAIEGAA